MDQICPFQNGNSTILNNSRFLNLYRIAFLLSQAVKNTIGYTNNMNVSSYFMNNYIYINSFKSGNRIKFNYIFVPILRLT